MGREVGERVGREAGERVSWEERSGRVSWEGGAGG